MKEENLSTLITNFSPILASIKEIPEKKQLIKKTPEAIQIIEEKKVMKVLSTVELQDFADDNAFLIQAIQEEERNAEAKAKKAGIKVSETQSFKDFFKLKPLNLWFKGSISYNTTPYNLSNGKLGRENLSFPISISPIKNFFLSANFKLDVNGYENIYYQPDFSYSFGYSDWHTDTWGLNYSNYANNKFSPKVGEERFNFNQGRWDLNYKTKVEDVGLNGSLQYTEEGQSTAFKLTASKVFFDKISTSAMWKHYFNYPQERLTLSAKSFIYKKFMVGGSAYLYSSANREKELEPDYAYSFGWYDSRPYYPTITYSNYYMPTRWGGREQKDVPFASGIVSVTINF